MTSQNKAWQDLETAYLDKVEKALSSVRHPHIAEVLEDVRSHLDQRFAELGPDEQTRETFETLIAQMGPACDYVELLSQGPASSPPKTRGKYLLLASLAIVLIAVVVLPKMLSPTVGYIVEFEPIDSFHPQTAAELLKAFNDEVKFRITTHHFRTEVRESTLIGYICTDTKADKGAIASILNDSKMLKLISIKAASSKDLEKHYVRAQPSLANGMQGVVTDSTAAKPASQVSAPLVVSTTPRAFDDNVSPDLGEITVTFDQPMMNLSWAWMGNGDTFPKTIGQPRYDKSRTTCSWRVKLDPGKFYFVGINSPRDKYFQTTLGKPAQPYVILFATTDKNGEPTAIPENYIEEAQEINSRSDKLRE